MSAAISESDESDSGGSIEGGVPTRHRPNGTPHVERLQADADLIEFFRSRNFQGSEWKRFQHELLAYGLARVAALVAAGTIFVQASVLAKRPVVSARDRIQDCDRSALINGAVLRGFQTFFRRGILGREWSPERGASLATYFTNACILGFADEYKAWRKQQQSHLPEVIFETLDELESRATVASYSDGGDELAVLGDLLDAMTKEEVDLFTLVAQGYSQREIARRLKTTERAIEGRIHRIRKRLRFFRGSMGGVGRG